MRYTLKDYQEDAVREVLNNLEIARDLYSRGAGDSQFSLSAATGSGKTVMAAAVIEALFFGVDEFDFPADPGAVVLWFSDDPSLNEQSRMRIQAAAPELINRMTIIEPPFAEESLRPGYVYFLNTQKLSKNARLVRAERELATDPSALFTPDTGPSIYDVLANTINTEGVTLYFILDEAHRGMKPAKERKTIVQRLINGQGATPPVPIVLGISATVERFDEAMRGIRDRIALPSVEVDPKLVQASGLLKDDIVLSIPTEAGTFDTVLLKRAVDKVRAATRAWEDYAFLQGTDETVEPLLVVQLGDKPTEADLVRTVDAIYEGWPELPDGAVANVFGEHKDLLVGGYQIPYIEPQRVQDAKWCRVLLAKTAISTGWDCPRAEVLVSFRPASDPTHITQLLGRMIRTPLARRIPGNELLNSVDCLLPFFDKKTAMQVANLLMSGATGKDSDTGGGEGRRILFDPVQLRPRTGLPESVWDKFESLPSQTVPKAHVKPIRRLTALATALAKDGLKEGAVADAYAKLCSALDGRAVQYKIDVDEARRDVETMSGAELRKRLGYGDWETTEFTTAVDLRALDDSYRNAARALSPQLAGAYVNHLAVDEDRLLEAQIETAALGRVPQIVNDIEEEADKISRTWLDETRVARKNLTDEKQSEYDRLEGMSLRPERTVLNRPHTAQVDSMIRNPDGTEVPLPAYKKHLLVDSDNLYPAELNSWEHQVVETETTNPGFLGWYRNPERGGKESLAIPYREHSKWKALRPDFIFFSEANGRIVADIVDPHGDHLGDALPKLKGLAEFAEVFGNEFRRIEATAVVGDQMRVLDLTRASVRRAIIRATNARALYESEIASDYL